MKKRVLFFKPYNKHGLSGYHIPVRNMLSNKVEEEFIPEEARELFENKFGKVIIGEDEFLDWYCSNVKEFNK